MLRQGKDALHKLQNAVFHGAKLQVTLPQLNGISPHALHSICVCHEGTCHVLRTHRLCYVTETLAER